ncbi:MAG: AbrB family transcriptional regulator [Xanthobacteraceae bacterium]|nr:AbrB family transcriptional regulator [Xanthobacteraceae bacterium]
MTEQTKITADPRGQPVGTVQLKRIGNSSGFILPKDIIARLNISVGDAFYATLTPDGGLRLTPYDPKFEKAMEVARRGMKIYRNALAELAK